jgi:hypothetical protein
MCQRELSEKREEEQLDL